MPLLHLPYGGSINWKRCSKLSWSFSWCAAPCLPSPPFSSCLSALSRCLDKSLDSTYLSRLIGQTGRQTKRSCARFKIDRSIESSTPLSSGSPRLACRICILWQLQLGSSCNNICSFNLTSAAIATQSRTWKTSDDKRRVVNKNCAERDRVGQRGGGRGLAADINGLQGVRRVLATK